jgi:ABC-2 type transport system ATP-binding protein
MIRIAHVTKTYGASPALVDVDLHVAGGESLGLVGPNASGRTTLLRIVATLVRPSSGTVEIDGLDVVRHVYRLRPRIAYVDGESLAAEPMRVGEYVRFVLAARSRAATSEIIADAVARAGLDDRATCTSLSGGMRQRLALGVALMARPDVLLLDDPFRALDAAGRSRFVEWLLEARERGAAIMLATQSDDDIAVACTRVARFDRGHLAGVSAVSKSTAAPRPAEVLR